MLNERHKGIVELLKEKQKVSVKELSDVFFVSEATIRRDLTELKSLGLIERAHGLALHTDHSEEVSIYVRINENANEKEKAVSNAILKLPEFQSVFVDSSSTALALAQRIDLRFKTVVTNSLQTAMLLSRKKDINLILLGGVVQYNTVSTTGGSSVRQINDFVFDLMISSCAAIQDDEVLERTMEQKEIKSAAFLRSKKRILIADQFKFNAKGIYRVARLGDYDMVATDCSPSQKLLDKGISFEYGQK